MATKLKSPATKPVPPSKRPLTEQERVSATIRAMDHQSHHSGPNRGRVRQTGAQASSSDHVHRSALHQAEWRALQVVYAGLE